MKGIKLIEARREVILVASCIEIETVNTLGIKMYYNIFKFRGKYKSVEYIDIKSKVRTKKELLEVGENYIIYGLVNLMPVQTAKLFIEQTRAVKL